MDVTGVPWESPQGGTGEILEVGNTNRAGRGGGLSPVEERKQEALQASGAAWEVGMLATSGLDKHTAWVTGSEPKVRAGKQQRPDPCEESPGWPA